MGRNRKDGFEYHSLDSAIRNDIKVRRLTKVGGAEATLSYIYILGYIYEKGYYAVFNDELVFDISDSLYCDEENINKHLELFFRFELFDKTIFDKYKVLTSHGLQERYKKMCKSVNRICIMDDYNLLEISSEEGDDKDSDISSDKPPISSEEKGGNKEEINSKLPIPSDKLPISSEFPLYIKEKEENILLSNESVQNSDSRSKPKPQKERTLNTKAKEVFEEYYKDTFGNNYYWSAKDAGGMAQLLKKIKFQLGGEPTDDMLIESLKNLLSSITDKWVLEHMSISILNSKYNEILPKMKSNTQCDFRMNVNGYWKNVDFNPSNL